MKRATFKADLFQATLMGCMILLYSFSFKGCSPQRSEPGPIYHSLYQKAEDLRFLGKYNESSRSFREALKRANRGNFALEAAKCLKNLGYLAWDVGKIQEAKALLTEGLLIASETNEPSVMDSYRKALEIIEAYMRGRQARAENAYSVSIEHFDRAIFMGRRAQLPSFVLKSLRQKASSCWHMGSLDAYFECNSRALEIARQINHRTEEGRCLNNLGAFYARLNAPYRALKYFEEARSCASAEEDISTLAECLTNMATIHMNLENYERAENLAADAYALDRQTGDESAIIMDLNNLASINLKLAQKSGDSENLDKSLSYLSECLPLLSNGDRAGTRIRVMNNIGALHYLRDDFHQADDFFAEALEEAQASGIPEIKNALLLNLGLVAFRRGEIEDALPFLWAAIDSAEDSNDLDILWEAQYGLGLYYQKTGDENAAIKAYRDSIHAIEKARKSTAHDIYKIGFAPSRIAPFQKAVDILFTDYSAGPTRAAFDEMFHIIERAKAQAFLEGIEDAAQTVPEIGDRICSVSDVQHDLLDEKTALLEYFLGESGSYLIVLTNRYANVFRIADHGAIKRSLRGYLKYISSPSGSSIPAVNAAAARIGQELLFPLKALSHSGIDKIIVIPDGVLCYLPFETLSLEDGRSTRFLVESHCVQYAPSASALYTLKAREIHKPHQKALLAFGAPISDFGRGDAGSLPSSKQEVLEITKILEDHVCDVYLEGGAIEENIKSATLEGFQILHFAAHGLSDTADPFRSALIVSRSAQRREDGALRMDEIGRLKTNADLVVLSACQTGSGALDRSEGLLSISRIFFYAGARSVLAALWPVSDSATTELMIRFYDYLARGNDSLQSLRSAKLAVIGSGRSHPFFWAGFVLNGPAVALRGLDE